MATIGEEQQWTCDYWKQECDKLSWLENPVDKAFSCSQYVSCSEGGGATMALPDGGRPPYQTPDVRTPSEPSSENVQTITPGQSLIAPSPPRTPPIATTAAPSSSVTSGMSTDAKLVLGAFAVLGALYFWKSR